MILEKLNWMDQALTLLEKISEFPKDAKLIMMLRHSEREPISSLKKNSDLQLTENGHLAARILRDTALDILCRFRKMGGKGVDGGSLEPLYALKVIKDNFFKNELQKFSLLEIMNHWINEQYDSNDIEPIKSYSKRAAHVIWSKLNQALPIGESMFTSLMKCC